MKGIEKITARIESDGKAETVQMLKEAEEKAAALLRQTAADFILSKIQAVIWIRSDKSCQ